MIADTHATRGERRRRHRLLDVLRCLFVGLIFPALAIVARVFVRTARVRTRRRLSASIHAGREPIRTQGSRRRSGPFAPTRRVRLRARVVAPREPPFSVVRVASDFSPRDYAATFAALQRPTSGQVLDLVPARLLCADVFERLAAAWTAGADAMARLGILPPSSAG